MGIIWKRAQVAEEEPYEFQPFSLSPDALSEVEQRTAIVWPDGPPQHIPAAQAVLSEAAAMDQEREHEGQRSGVRHAGGACACSRSDALGVGRDVLLAAQAEPGAELAGEVVLAELLALR